MRARAQDQSPVDSENLVGPPVAGHTVDGVAVRIEDDIITESEVRELGKFQELVDGKEEPRAKILEELEDQWIIRGDASATKVAQPSEADVQKQYDAFVKQFGPMEAFEKKLQEVGLTDKDVRRLVASQLYYSRFLDFRFRPAAQVDDEQVADYYRDQLVTAMKAKGETPPPLDQVQERIHEVLVQQAITKLADNWLDETRAQLKIEIPGRGARK
ncbi:MAG TPA: hypothetical protein VMU43_05745 [Candidatus Acidoferrum sp.]|nr:hypothetical protein [Candidatus Acidoferrum sp.]